MYIDGKALLIDFMWLGSGVLILTFFLLIGILFFGVGKNTRSIIKKG